MVELRFSAEASSDLLDIFAFSVERFGLTAANNYHDGLEAICERLRHFPEMGPVHPGLRPSTRILSFRSHHVLYRVDSDIVTVIRILHHAMNAVRHLRQ